MCISRGRRFEIYLFKIEGNSVNVNNGKYFLILKIYMEYMKLNLKDRIKGKLILWTQPLMKINCRH